MSEQPVKCKMEDKDCVEFTTKENCNPTCDFYNPVDDSTPEEIAKKITEVKPVLQFSNLPKFDKQHEFLVFKKHAFQLQSISPKKIILKFKRKFTKADAIPDGCYIFKNPITEEILDISKVFGVLAKNARVKERAMKARNKAIKEAREKAERGEATEVESK